LSYAAAFQLRLIKAGSGLVEVETIDTSPEALKKISTDNSAQTASLPQMVSTENSNLNKISSSPQTTSTEPEQVAVSATSNTVSTINTQYFVQAGAFKNEANGDLLQKRIQSLQLGENVGVANVYNNGLYRVKLGPFTSKSDADISAANIRRQLNIAAHVTNQ